MSTITNTPIITASVSTCTTSTSAPNTSTTTTTVATTITTVSKDINVSNDDKTKNEIEISYYNSLRLQLDWLHPKLITFIWNDMTRNYYSTRDWSPEVYMSFAYHGFVSVASEPDFLLPEMQRSYGSIVFKDLHIAKKVKKRSKRYTLTLNQNLQAVLEGIENHHADNWVIKPYCALWKKLTAQDSWCIPIDGAEGLFRAYSCELWDPEFKKVIAGEIGYTIGSTYTSLTGFWDADAQFEPGSEITIVGGVNDGRAGIIQGGDNGAPKKSKNGSYGVDVILDDGKKLGYWIKRKDIKPFVRRIFEPKNLGMSFNGNLVTDVIEGSQAYALGVKNGWQIKFVNGNPQTNNTKQITAAIEETNKAGKTTIIDFSMVKSQKQKYASAGKIQLVGLGKLLEAHGIKFWNLGHPFKPHEKDVKYAMMYKKEIGARNLDRAPFLNQWVQYRDINPKHVLQCPDHRCVRDILTSQK